MIDRDCLGHYRLLVEAYAKIDRLRHDCGEFYQIIGYLGTHAGLFDEPQTQKALDNASAAAEDRGRPHDDLLPFDIAGLDNSAAIKSVEPGKSRL